MISAPTLFVTISYLALLFYYEREQVSRRLRRVSQMLQTAELDTGVPYFTCLGNYLPIENPTTLLIAKRCAVFRPIVSEEEEEEKEEQSSLDKRSESDQSEQSEQSEQSSEEEAASDISNMSNISKDSQVIPLPDIDLDQYVPIFQIKKEN